jgi:hypothetical protein
MVELPSGYRQIKVAIFIFFSLKHLTFLLICEKSKKQWKIVKTNSGSCLNTDLLNNIIINQSQSHATVPLKTQLFKFKSLNAAGKYFKLENRFSFLFTFCSGSASVACWFVSGPDPAQKLNADPETGCQTNVRIRIQASLWPGLCSVTFP